MKTPYEEFTKRLRGAKEIEAAKEIDADKWPTLVNGVRQTIYQMIRRGLLKRVECGKFASV